MRAGHKFAIGATIIVAAVVLLITEGVKQTGMYFLTPTELAAKTQADESFYELGLKVGAKVVPGSIVRTPTEQRVDFRVSDGGYEFPVTYVGIVPDTFTDANDIEVIVEGKYGRDGIFRATEVLAKCGSRYEAVHEEVASGET
ncbi:MAG TPA: cytochrome c maturation protein CcmE [Gemmatimonadales bacterium]|nr:cytochrome c maturation protein CcmE [Gemmatimonadales bacterium]